MKRIIYQTNEGLAILIPTGDLTNEEVARKDVPAGVDYWIVDTTSIPEDRTFRGAWEADLTALGAAHGKGIGQDAWFAEQAEKKAAEEAQQDEVTE